MQFEFEQNKIEEANIQKFFSNARLHFVVNIGKKQK